MNATLLRILLGAAARSVEQGTLTEIVETAAKLMALVKPLLAEADALEVRRDAASAADPQAR